MERRMHYPISLQGPEWQLCGAGANCLTNQIASAATGLRAKERDGQLRLEGASFLPSNWFWKWKCSPAALWELPEASFIK